MTEDRLTFNIGEGRGTKTDMEYIAKIKNLPIGKVEDTIQKIINSEIGIMSHRFENVSLIYQMLGKEAVNCLIEQIKAGEVDIMSEHKEETIHDRIRELIEEYRKQTGIRIDSIGIEWWQRGIGEDKTIMEIRLNSTKTRY